MIAVSHQTARLLLSPARPEDAPALYEFLGDPVAMRYTEHSANLEACRHRIMTHEAQRVTHGCAPWVIREITTQRVIGWGGLYHDPFDPGWGMELGYFFAPSAWGQGYATELGLACIEMARLELKLPVVKAFSHPENLVSQKVLEKTGFTKKDFIQPMNRFLFEFTFPDTRP